MPRGSNVEYKQVVLGLAAPKEWQRITFLGVPILKSFVTYGIIKKYSQVFGPYLSWNLAGGWAVQPLYFATIMNSVTDIYHILSVDVNHAMVLESVAGIRTLNCCNQIPRIPRFVPDPHVEGFAPGSNVMHTRQ